MKEGAILKNRFFKAILILVILVFVTSSCGENKVNNSDTDFVYPYENQFRDVTYFECTYILNRNTKKFHYKDCYTIELMNEKNKIYCDDNRINIIQNSYSPCKKCNP